MKEFCEICKCRVIQLLRLIDNVCICNTCKAIIFDNLFSDSRDKIIKLFNKLKKERNK